MGWLDKAKALVEDDDRKPVEDDDEPTTVILEEDEYQFDEDPAPGKPAKTPLTKTPRKLTKPRGSARGRRPSQRSAVVREASADVQTAVEMIAFMWGMSGDPCAQVLDENSKNISAAVMKILSRNPALLERLQDSGILWDCVGLGAALMPVGKAVYKHHVRKEEIDAAEDDLNDFPAYVPGAGSLGVGGPRIPGVMG